MKTPNPKQHFDRLIRARYPVIQIVSHEERRVQNAVAKIAQAQGKAFFVWTASRGTRNATPHDLRRTFSKLARQGGAPLEQIQLALGHTSIQTTERYLGTAQDLTDGPGDHIALDLTWEDK